ncbi:hypothetical protein CSUI_005021 [Cystoisospora suis]|uniref:Uncharacterized protein n=1 Tax=Cystoisospora suis TaxID=483139 RepID=A0A2C6KZE8_9APIC|nr:hypothetical protein CSUI_005021 [Cystoisospora suis]
MGDDILSGIDADDLIAGLAADAEDAAAEAADPSTEREAAAKEKKRESVDQTSLDKKAGLNKFRDLEKLREEQRRQQEEEQEAEKKRKGAYSGKKWEVTKPAGPVRPQEAGMLRVAEAVKSEQTKLSPREEIEEQTKKDREKRGLRTSVSPAPVAPLGKERKSLASGETNSQELGEEGDKAPPSPGSKSVEGAGVKEGDEAAEESQKLASAAEAVGPGTGTTSRVEETKAEGGHQLPEGKAPEDGPGDKTHFGGKDGADTGDSVALSRGSSQDEQGNKFSSEFKAEVEKLKQKVPGFLVCYNKKGVKEPKGSGRSSVALDADEAGESQETEGNKERRWTIQLKAKEGGEDEESSAKEETDN